MFPDSSHKHRRRTIAIIFVVFLFFSPNLLAAQEQFVADSLKSVLEELNLNNSQRFQIIEQIIFNENNLDEGIKYANYLLKEAKKENNNEYLYHGYLQKGYKLNYKGDFSKALDSFFKSVEFSKKVKFQKGEAIAYGAIASTYTTSGNHRNAISYFRNAINILRLINENSALAGNILNMGDAYLTHGDYDSALVCFEEANNLFFQLNHYVGQAYALGNTGMVHANLGNHHLAEKNINQAIDILEEMGDFYPVCFYLISMADIFRDRGDIEEALTYAQKSLNLARQYELKQQISDANEKLSELHEKQGNPKKSLKYYKAHITYRDSVTNLETVQKMADQRTEFEVNLRETEIDALEKDKELQRTYIIIAISLFFLSFVILLYFRQRFRNTRLKASTKQKEHDDQVKDLLKTQETKALQAMVQGKEQERKHLAKELHNHLGSLLATVKVNLNGLDSEDQAKHQNIIGLVDQATQDVRNISHELNMGISDDFGLVPAIKELIQHIKQANKLDVLFSAHLNAVQIDSQSEIIVYRIIQELISNVLKHAEATKLNISLTGFEEDNLVNILVDDNGQGIDAYKLDIKTTGMGLASLKEMIQKLDGEMNIDSSPQSGTTISIDLSFTIPENIIES